MSTITTIASGDYMRNSRSDINTNFSNLNSDKIETSTLDTDTTLAANSDSKIATQKAVKAYVDAGGNVNASETTRGIVEEATDAEVTAGTATGGTGAQLFVTPTKLATRMTTLFAADADKIRTVGALSGTYAKTYFNMQFPFILWTGSTSGALTTDFTNWTISSTDITVTPAGAMASFGGTGADYIEVVGNPFYKNASAGLGFSGETRIMSMDFWAYLPTTSSGDITMGFSDGVAAVSSVYNSSTYDKAAFTQKSTGELYATIANAGVGVTNTDISSGYTAARWNNFRIEVDIANNCLFYLNGTLKATLSGANMPDGAGLEFGFGRSNNAAFIVTAPNLAMEMNP